METSIFLSNREVVAVEGIRKSGKMEIFRIIRGMAPENSIINGIVTDEPGFDAFFRTFWNANRLSDRHVTLVLGNAQAVTRYLKLPPMSHKHRMRYLEYEFADVERTKHPVISYVKIGKERRKEILLASMTSQQFLEKHIFRFLNMGICLKSVILAETADILALNQVSAIREKNCIVQIPDGVSILNILYENGHYVQMNRARILSEPGSMGYGTECACMVNRFLKLAKEKIPESPVTHVYLAGGFRQTDYEIYRDSMLKMDDSLIVEFLETECIDEICFKPETCCMDFSRDIAAIGGLMGSGKRNNLLYQYRRSLESERRKIHRFQCLGKCLAAVGIPAMIICVQLAHLRQMKVLVEKQQEYLDHAEAVQLSLKYEMRKQDLEEMQMQIAEMQTFGEMMQEVPSYTAEVYQTLENCADGLAEFEVKSYRGWEFWDKKLSGGRSQNDKTAEETKGEVIVSIRCDDPEHVHRFVERLESKRTVIQSTEYTGFVWNERQQNWRAEIRIQLKRQGGVG
ncbi:MAG: hypothetical protein ACI39W_09670 [Brotaphodocola sp.]